MFVRKKTTAGGSYYYLVASGRAPGGKVRQRVLCYLGEFATVEAALAGLPGQVAEHREKAEGARRLAEALRRLLRPGEDVTRADMRRVWRGRKADHYRYWHAREDEARHGRQAAECAARLARLRQVLAKCSAQNPCLVATVLGTTTTPPAKKGAP
jgi:hypothetical protein